MKLRYLVICDKHGQKTEPMLQFYNKEFKTWDYVDGYEIKEGEDDTKEVL